MADTDYASLIRIEPNASIMREEIANGIEQAQNDADNAVNTAENANNTVNIVNERVDEIIAHGADGSLEELVDIRNRGDGTVATTAGDRVRELGSQLAEKAKQVDLNATNANISDLQNTKADKTYVDGKFGTLANPFIFKGSDTTTNIQAKTGASVGDYWHSTDGNTNLAWNGTTWVDIGNNLNIGDGTVSPEKTNFINFKKQYIDFTTFTDGYYYDFYSGAIHNVANANCSILPRILLKSGITYSYKNAYAALSRIVTLDDTTLISNLSTDTHDTLSGTYTATQDCYLYLTVLTTNKSSCMIVNDTTLPSTYEPYGIYNLDINNFVANSINDGIVSPIKTNFLIPYNLLDLTTLVNGYYNSYSGGITSSTAAKVFPSMTLEAGTYYFKNIYANFCYYTNGSDYHGKFSTITDNAVSGFITFSQTVTVYCTTHIDYVSSVMLIKSSVSENNYYGHDVFMLTDKITIPGLSGLIIPEVTVKQDGTGNFTSVVDAVNYANGLNKNCNIIIYDGSYDILAELGGQTFLNSIVHSGTFAERQGLILKDNVNLYGIGRVILTFQLPDTVTYEQSECVSCINLYLSNKIENIEFVAQNCRYVAHDETNGGNPYLKRSIKNCRFTHLGNISGLWEYPTVYGGGAGGGSQYDFIDCQFITNAYTQAWSFHTNSNEKPSHFNVDGCVGIVNSETGNSFNCTYYGTGQEGRTIFNIKNCSGNGIVRKAAEVSPNDNDHIDVYINGYNQITV